MTIQQLIKLKESEDKIEFKEAKTQYNYNNGVEYGFIPNHVIPH